MYTLRLIAVAVLFHGNDLLMMKRSPQRTLSPGKWAGIGGHLEPHEIGNPEAACLREMEEETGLRRQDLEELELRYILTRLNGSDIRQQFVYVGRTRHRQLAETEEGDLHWIPRAEILNREIPYVYRCVLEHWLIEGHKEKLWMATATLEKPVSGDNGGTPKPHMVFTPILDPGMN